MWVESINGNQRIRPPESIPPLIWRILESKGIFTEEEAERVLSPSLQHLSHPGELDGMDVAVERLLKAREAREQLAVYGDFDLDGTSGAALLVEGLTSLGFKAPKLYQPKRLSEGYGFHAHAVEALHGEGVSLIVTVDVGITAVEACRQAKELGVDVIITDHHQPKEVLPEALAVVNPNKGTCPSGLTHLAGTGVGFYLLLGLNAGLKAQGEASGFNPKELLDFFAIGTVTDMVPLVKENRVLVKHGLKALSRTPRPGLKSLLTELKLYGEDLTSHDLAMTFAPKLNALSRLEADIRPVDLYLEKNPVEASRLCEETINVNKERVSKQRYAEKLAMDMVQDTPGFVWVYSEEFHKGVIGLVATKLANKYSLPAYVGALVDGKISGSARAPRDNESLSVLEGLEAASEALNGFGGHHAAAGFEVTPENVGAFTGHLERHFDDLEIEEGVCMPKALVYSAECRLSEVNPGFMNWYSSLEPFGVGFETPVIKCSGVTIVGGRTLKGGHLRLTVEQDLPGHRLEAIWFSPPGDHPIHDRSELGKGQSVDLFFQPQWNRFMGRKSLQLLVQDLEF